MDIIITITMNLVLYMATEEVGPLLIMSPLPTWLPLERTTLQSAIDRDASFYLDSVKASPKVIAILSSLNNRLPFGKVVILEMALASTQYDLSYRLDSASWDAL